MSLSRALIPIALVLAPLAAAGPARAGEGGCCTASFGIFCPKTTFCRVKPPCIKWHCVCPKPVCDCGSLEHYGYYPTCWHPWPFPPDYSHCHQPPPSALADQLINEAAAAPVVPSGETLPTPRRANGGEPGL